MKHRYRMHHCLYNQLLLSLMYISSFALEDYNKTGYNNCLTWRDDQNVVFLTCRVSNFVLPVTFVHENSNTNVKCSIIDGEQYCIPKEKKITIDKYEHTVTIVLIEQKHGRDLDGRWHCLQGKSAQSTEVSLSKGIIKDSWVQLRGSVENGSKYIQLECSSCRVPKGPYAEIIVNNQTEASFWQHKHGDCWYRNTKCSFTDICSCSQTGNMFFFRLQIQHSNISSNLSCHMQFNDSLRTGTFSITASHIFKGKDFEVIENKSDVIKPNKPISDHVTLWTLPVDLDGTKRTTSVIKEMTSTSSPDIDNEALLRPEIVALISVLVTVTITTMITLLIWLYRKCKTKADRNARGTFKKVNQYDDDQRESKQERRTCKSCAMKSVPKSPELFCFTCCQFFCLDCKNLIHGISEEMQFHKCVNTSELPESFSSSMFECRIAGHNSLYKHLCTEHMRIHCRKCMFFINSECNEKCNIQLITDISPEHVLDFIHQLFSDLSLCVRRLDAYCLFLQEGKNTFKAQMATVKDKVASMTSTNLASTDKTPTTLNLLKQLDNSLKKYENHVKNLCDKINTWRSNIRSQTIQLEFLQSHAENYQIYSAGLIFKGKLSEFKNKIKCHKRLIYQQTITVEGSNINIKKLGLNDEESLTKLTETMSASDIKIHEENTPIISAEISAPSLHSSTANEILQKQDNRGMSDDIEQITVTKFDDMHLEQPIEFLSPTSSKVPNTEEKSEVEMAPVSHEIQESYIKNPSPLSGSHIVMSTEIVYSNILRNKDDDGIVESTSML